jgi:16S rRNA (uracil1498-N3)-methyltransferase
MKRFILPMMPGPEGRIRLYEEDYHYLVRVRRLKAGSSFDAVLPDGTETLVHVLSTADNILVGECLEAAGKPPSPIPPIALFQGIPKGSKMDLVIRQAAEGAVSLVAPFESEYSTVKLSGNASPGRRAGDEKLKRWKRIVREARQQSGSTIETLVREPCGFDALLEFWESLKKEYRRPLGILLHQAPLEKGTFHDYLNIVPDFVVLATGPEGGFSPGEVSLFLAAGFKPLLIGDTVLRTATAALYGTAAVRTILLESETWTLRSKK